MQLVWNVGKVKRGKLERKRGEKREEKEEKLREAVRCKRGEADKQKERSIWPAAAAPLKNSASIYFPTAVVFSGYDGGVDDVVDDGGDDDDDGKDSKCY